MHPSSRINQSSIVCSSRGRAARSRDFSKSSIITSTLSPYVATKVAASIVLSHAKVTRFRLCKSDTISLRRFRPSIFLTNSQFRHTFILEFRSLFSCAHPIFYRRNIDTPRRKMTSASPPLFPQRPRINNSIRVRKPTQSSYIESTKSVALSKPSEMQCVPRTTLKRASSLPAGKLELPRDSRKLFWFLSKQRQREPAEQKSSDDFYFPLKSFTQSKKVERFILPRRSQYPTLLTPNFSNFSADESGHTDSDEEDLLGLSFCDDDDDGDQ